MKTKAPEQTVGQRVTVFNAEKGQLETVPKVYKTREEWRALLSPEEYEVSTEGGTEPPFNNRYNATKEQGIYECVRCGNDLFSSDTKYNSGTGWPSFWAPVAPENVYLQTDRTLFMERTEVLCARCDAHLGHVFDDGPEPTGKRYCMNSLSLRFKKKEK